MSKNGEDELSQMRSFLGDGFFGGTFFGDRIWRFNYQSKTIELCSRLPSIEGMISIPMAFKTVDGQRTSHHPRIEVVIGGTKVPMLFDTGGTSLYTAEARKLMPYANPFTSSSFIRKSVADAWLRANPTWRYIKGGDRFSGGTDLVEVPEITVGGLKVGPVWFATRQDNIYDNNSKEYMDARIDGAIGGNALQYFVVIADYSSSKLYLKKSPKE